MLLVALPRRLPMVSFRGHKKHYLIYFVTLEQIPKIKIFHIVASEHPEVVEGRWRFIATDVLDSEEEDYYGSTDNDGTYFDE